MAALLEFGDRLGLDLAPHLTANGRPRWLILGAAALVSLGLWIGIGWLLARLAAWLTT